jgi:hypothetical protein
LLTRPNYRPGARGQVQRYNAKQIGNVLAWTGLPQLLLIPLVPLLMKRYDPRYIGFVGISIFAVSPEDDLLRASDRDFLRTWLENYADDPAWDKLVAAARRFRTSSTFDHAKLIWYAERALRAALDSNSGVDPLHADGRQGAASCSNSQSPRKISQVLAAGAGQVGRDRALVPVSGPVRSGAAISEVEQGTSTALTSDGRRAPARPSHQSAEPQREPRSNPRGPRFHAHVGRLHAGSLRQAPS